MKVKKSEEEWKRELSPGQFRILRKKDTEMPFTGKYYYNKENGIYMCGACKNPLFSSDAKYDSGTGWPSFFKPISKESVNMKRDESFGIARREVICKKCNSHLGHVFDDGPKPTGKRYCINSLALNFKKRS